MAKPRPIEIGLTDGKVVHMSPRRRRTHLHIIGPSESGKTRLFEHMIKQDIKAGHGMCVLDPTGSLYKRLALWSAARGMHRRRRMHFMDPNSDHWVPAFNPLLLRPGEDIAKRVDAVVLACAQVWNENASKTPLLKRCLRVIFTALIEHGLTLVEGIELVMQPTNSDEERIRSFLTRELDNPYAKKVWAEFNQLKAERLNETFSSTNNRMADFLMSERMAQIFGCGTGALDLRACMDESHMLFVNLQPLHISADNARLLGTLITTELLQLARSRDNARAEKRPFYCYLDEAYLFLTSSIEQAIDITRQKGLHYILAHQRLEQLSDAGPNIYSAVMSIRNKILFGDLEASDTDTLVLELHQADYDENQDIGKLRRPIVVDYEVKKNRQRRVSKQSSRSKSGFSGKARMASEVSNLAISHATDAFGLPYTGTFMDGGGSGSSNGRAQSKGVTVGENKSGGVTEGWAESAWPVLEERSGSLRSFDDQMHIFAKRLRRLPPRHILFKVRLKEPKVLKVPHVGDPITHERRLPAFFDAVGQRSPYLHTAAQARDFLKERRASLIKKASPKTSYDEPLEFFE